MTPRHRSVLARVVVLAAVLVGLSAGPASADPAGPSDFRSEVTGIVPKVAGVHAEVRGGDTFLEVRADRGHEVIVEGYQGEPYLRIDKDGTVERNRLSPATYLNNSRFAKVTVPPDANPKATPIWEKVGSGGHYAWHDHRIHWMGGGPVPVPRGHKVTGAFDPWQVPLLVDGTPVTVRGTLTYEDAMSPLPWVALVLVAGAALAILGRRRAVLASAGSLAVVSVLGVIVGRADFSSTPGGGNPLFWMLPAVAVVGAVVALVPRAAAIAVIGALASVASLSGWALLRHAVLTKPGLPTDLPAWLDRATVAAGLGIAIAAAYLVVTSGAIKLPELPDD